MPTWGSWYWPLWLSLLLLGFIPAEIYGLVTNSQNTLSAWVWRALHIARDQDWAAWSATDFLVFGCWIVLIVWLTAHLFLGRFT